MPDLRVEDGRTADVAPNGANAASWEKQLTATGAISTFLTCLSAPFTNTYKVLGWVLFAVSAALLLLIAIVRINDGLRVKRRYLMPLVSGMFLICLIAVGLAGWTIMHPAALAANEASPRAKGETKDAAPATTNDYKITTTGDGSPVVTGDGSSVTVRNSDEPKRAKKKGK